jgi:hypothetical protein
MTEQTLLVILVAMTTLAWVGIAAVLIAIGWQVYSLVVEIRAAVARVQEAGESVIAEVARMREKFTAQSGAVRTMLEVGLGALVQKFSKPRSASRPKTKKSATVDVEVETE